MFRTALATVLMLACMTAFAEDKKSQPPDEKAMMEAFAKHATPGEAHKKLEPLAGSWTYSGKMWMDPSAPPTAFTGEAESKWLLDGRFLGTKVTGDIPMFGKFEGYGVTGYDNALKKYHGFWIDNMSTSQTTSTGTVDSTGKVFTSDSQCFDAMTGKTCKTREVTTIISNDEHTSAFYKLEDGKEIKTMEIHSKRKK